MKYMKADEIRKSFMDFFESKEHYARKSYSLVPQNDKSILLINAGMVPMKNYFMGIEDPPSKRMVTYQKCVRTGDIDNVGKTARHATFFEMLGNFSFGDYFKKEAIAWSWEYVTKVLELDEKNLWVTVYLEDDEAFDIWENSIGVDKNKIVRLGKEDNFWEIGTGTGPCGPCSEIYIDRGLEFGCGHEDCKPGCDCDRFLEFWNLVFTQFNKNEQGEYIPLENPNIDTGMGLERMACIMQDVTSIFDIDNMKNIRDHVCRLSDKEYQKDANTDISIRLITDHCRAVTFMIGDGILPSNEGRGYVLRRLIRRAARHGRLIGIKENFINEILDTVVEDYKTAYPEIAEKKEYIRKILKIEEEKFSETIDQGIQILQNYIDNLNKNKEMTLKGADAFKLYDTYGFPLELTVEILEENNMNVNEEEFKTEMQSQRERARNARTEKGIEGWSDDLGTLSLSINKNEFLGYDFLKTNQKIMDIIIDSKMENSLKTGDQAILIFEQTPFYAESGGQVADSGIIRNSEFEAVVEDVKKTANGLFMHYIIVTAGSASKGDSVELIVEEDIRKATQRNHTATHILHKALKLVLGDHIHQAGSLVSDKRCRFDFTHFEPITKKEIAEIEAIVNKAIYSSYDVTVTLMTLDEAKESKAVALFDEKYEDKVRVISVGDFSRELCGGTHVKNSSDIGIFKILSETGIASGVRRIEAITGSSVYDYILRKEFLLEKLQEISKTTEENLIVKIENSLEELKNTQKELSLLKKASAKDLLAESIKNAKTIGNIKYIKEILDDVEDEVLRDIAQSALDSDENSVVLLSSIIGEKISFVCMVSKKAIDKGVHAGKFIKQVSSITGGGGGGKPNMAQAGGKDISKLEEAMEKSDFILENIING